MEVSKFITSYKFYYVELVTFWVLDSSLFFIIELAISYCTPFTLVLESVCCSSRFFIENIP